MLKTHVAVVQPPGLFLCPDHDPPRPVGEPLEHAPPPPFTLIPAMPNATISLRHGFDARADHHSAGPASDAGLRAGRYTRPLVSPYDGILVTGGAGFVGATLVRRLVASGYRVRVLDNLSTGDAAHLAGVDAELVKGDIRDAAALDDALEGMEAIIHLAAAGSVIGSVQDPE